VPTGKAVKINFVIFGLTSPGLKPRSTAPEASTRTIKSSRQFVNIICSQLSNYNYVNID